MSLDAYDPPIGDTQDRPTQTVNMKDKEIGS